MTRLILTGFMGTGKTTVGRLVARRFGLCFADLDEAIERREGKSVAEMFSERGEATFRRLESEVLRELIAADVDVIATGGGTLVSPDNRALIHGGQTVLCLTCAPDELGRRLDGHTYRPLLSGNQQRAIDSLLRRRRPVYDLFEQVDTTGRTAVAVAEEVGERAGLWRGPTLSFEARHESRFAFQAGSLARVGELVRERDSVGDALLVTDETVARTGHSETVLGSLEETGARVHRTTIPSGEQHKTLDTVRQLYTECARLRLDRQTVVVGVGGGVVGDAAGFLAATYLRGLRLVLVPTTLLAQIDAAIGGKTGVDFAGAKNLVGAFHPASLVVIDPDTLRTLPVEQLSNGLAEAIKVAAVRSPGLLRRLERLSAPEDVLDHPDLIRWAVEAKIRVVRADPYDHGERMILNFGHTIGHGLEAASGYTLSHGEAVSAGMAAETGLAVEKGWCPWEVFDRLCRCLRTFHLPIAVEGVDPEAVLESVRQDKKRDAASIRVAIPTAAGRGEVRMVTDADICLAISWAIGEDA